LTNDTLGMGLYTLAGWRPERSTGYKGRRTKSKERAGFVPAPRPWPPKRPKEVRAVTAETTPIRLVHFSDVHVSVRGCVWRREDWMNKRMSAWINLRVLGRGFRFRRTEHV